MLPSQLCPLYANNSRWLRYGEKKPLQASFFTCIIAHVYVKVLPTNSEFEIIIKLRQYDGYCIKKV